MTPTKEQQIREYYEALERLSKCWVALSGADEAGAAREAVKHTLELLEIEIEGINDKEA